MKGTVKGSDLARAVGAVSKVVEQRATLPVLGGVRVEMVAALMDAPATMTVQGTDMQQFMSVTVPAMVDAAGEAVIGAARFAAICRDLADGDVSIDVGADFQAQVRGSGSRFRIPGMPTVDFPNMAAPDAGVSLRFKAASLVAGLTQTAFAASTESSRPALNGVLLRAEGDKVTLTATDGHRMAQLTVPVEPGGPAFPGVVIPLEAARRLIEIFSGADEALLLVGDNLLAAEGGGLRFVTRLIDAAFPNTDHIIEKTLAGPLRYKADAAQFQSAVRRALLVSDDRTKPVKLTFSPLGLTVSARDSEAGDAETTMPLTAPSSDAEIAVGLNGKYLQDALGLVGPVATLVIESALAPVAVIGDGGPVNVIMPMRLG